MQSFKGWIFCALMLLAPCFGVSAFTTNDAINGFTAYNTAFMTDGGYPGWWTGAEEIEMSEDAYDNTPSPGRALIVSNACNGFIANNGSSWTYDIYNDDMSWAVLAFVRGYLATGSTNFLAIATTNWNAMYNRAWDTNFSGGGLWWNTDNLYKNAAVQGPAMIGALYLYNIYSNTSYLTKAEGIYAWERQVLLNTSTGSIADGINLGYTTTSGGATTYNQGTFIGGANLLHRATGLPFYYQDAMLVGKYTQNSMTTSNILPQYGQNSDLSGFNGIFCRWMAHYAREENIWPAFGPWLTTNANAAWSVRNSNDLCWQEWGTPLGTNAPGDWGCSAAVVVMQVSDTTPLDALQITPTAGFTAVSQYTLAPNPTNITFTLTNIGSNAFNWALANSAAWLTVSATSGTLSPGGAAASVQVSLVPDATTNLAPGRYYSIIPVTNILSGITQSLSFLMVVSAGSAPIVMTGYNGSIIAPNSATSNAPGANAFDIPNNLCFFQAGLNGATRGMPPDGVFTSLADDTTVFQLGPYGGTNALVLGYDNPAAGTLTLATSQTYNLISVIACSANTSGSIGTLVLNFSNGTHSAALNFNAQDWFSTTSNVAIQGYGRLQLGSSFGPQDNGPVNPNVYQTTFDLTALGLTAPLSSITFTKPSGSGSQQTTGILAVSGMVMPAAPDIVQQPVSVTNTQLAVAATFSVVSSGIAPLSYQWYYSETGNSGSYTAVAGQTNSSLTYSAPLQITNDGSIYVTVTNLYGTVTSSVATLTVNRAPVITQQPSPTNLVLFPGRPTTFTSTGTGATLLEYLWTSNGATITGATTSNYSLTNLQTNDSANYSLILSNTFGTATSSVVRLTVVSNPISVYAQTVIAAGPAAYYRLDEANGTIAHDFMNGHNGVYTNAVLGAAGYDPNDPATTSATFGPETNSLAGDISLEFSTNINSEFSVEAWVKGNAQTTDAGIVAKGTGGGGEQLSLDTGSDSGNTHRYRFLVRDASGTAHLASGNIAPNGTWQHVVGVCNETAGYLALYVDGVSNAGGTITATDGILVSTNPLGIGSRQSGTTSYNDQFVGSLEEVAIYNYALTAAEVSNHYSVSTNVIIPPYFSPNPFTNTPAVATVAYSGSVATYATDHQGSSMTFLKISGPTWLTIASSGALSGTPAVGNIGTNTFVVRVIDSASLSNSGTMVVVVQGRPTFASNTFNEPAAYAGQAYSGSVSNEASDPDGSTLTWSLVSGPAWLGVAANGALSGTPATGNIGTDSFVVQAESPNGQTASATMMITVYGAPNFIVNPFSVPSITAGQAISGDIATNAEDPNPGATPAFALVSGPAWLGVSAAGNLSGTPVSSNVGLNSFVVSVTDSSTLSNTAALNINVLAAPPIVSAINLQGSNYILSWTGGVAPYQVQIATNLWPTSWTNVGAPANTNSLIVVPTNIEAFYRILGN